MLITSLGHAGLEVEHQGTRLQIDPWLSPQGAFQGSWFQWPDNSHLIDRLAAPDAVAISHEHLDHIDPWWLAKLPKETPIFVPRYPLDVLRQKILASGQTNIHEIEPWQDVEVLPGVQLFFVSERSPMNHDSAMVLRTGDSVFVNANDARLCPLQLHEIRSKAGHINLLALQGAGASWYPMVYQYDAAQKRELSLRKRMAKFAYVVQATRAAEPDLVLPFAGPPAFLDADLFHLNSEMEEGIFPDHEQVAQWMHLQGFKNVPFLYPGDRLDLRTNKIVRDGHWSGFRYADRARHLAEYASRRQDQLREVKASYPIPDYDLWPAFKSYFEELLTCSDYFNNRIGMKVGFEVTGPGGFQGSVDFRKAALGVYRDLDDIQYKYTFESRWLPSLLDRSVPWEDFLLSCRIKAWRDPDIYNDHLLGLLKFADANALAAVEAWEKSPRDEETIKVRSGCKVFEVARFCPHAGQDLLEVGEILPGDIIRCNGHHFEFDLLSGACVNGNTDPLATRQLDAQQESDLQREAVCTGSR
jgi:UDP-MurNAc hydroxylase